MFCISRGLNSSGDTVNRSAFWEICEAHAKLDAETIFSDTLAGFIVIGFLVSKETVVLRRWGRSKQKFGFIKRVDKC